MTQSSKGEWVVKVRKTGCRVGTLAMAVEAGRPVIRFLRPGSFDVQQRRVPRTDPIEVHLDHKKGVAWVDRADSLFGMPGYVMD